MFMTIFSTNQLLKKSYGILLDNVQYYTYSAFLVDNNLMKYSFGTYQYFIRNSTYNDQSER